MHNLLQLFPQKLLFVMGKGGVGKSAISASLATAFAKKNERVLVVQWSLIDSISPFFSDLFPFKTMNFSLEEAIKEYFVDHLKMKWFYSFFIKNKNIQKLIQAAPGISELFFLGRLFWLVELASQSSGQAYDRIIVDTPAMGHGVSLFRTAPAIARLGITGPLAKECDRVCKMIFDPMRTAVVIVTLPEELPVEESIEFIPKVTEALGYKPQGLFINQSIHSDFFPGLADSNITDELFLELKKRNDFETKLKNWAEENQINAFSFPDVNLLHAEALEHKIIQTLSEYMI